MRKFLIFIFIIIIIGVGAFAALPGYLSTSSNSQSVEIIVSKGDSLNSVAEDLYQKKAIRSRLWFRYNGKDIASGIKPGTYTIEPNTDIETMYEIIQRGEKETGIKVTFPEGFILYQFAQKVEEEGLGTAEDFIKASNEYFISKGYDFNTDNLYFNLEGYLFPDTYYFTKEQSVDDIVGLLNKTMESIFDDEYTKRVEELGMTKHEILTLASLIEREAYNDEERAKISGVIYNRLKQNMLLQIDATVIYGLGEGREHMTRVLYEDLKKDNPFNTYKNLGLPPGPIASPGKRSIEAALYPEEHDYLFYVMGENGHVFAKTYDEHLKNVNKYRQ